MKRTGVFILLFILLFSAAVFAEEKGDVYVIPIRGEINKASYNYLNSTLKEIEEKSSAAIIFEIDTYGGLINEAEKIKNLIIDLKVPTISFVNTKAESAGVLIAISSEKVVMAKSSTIGSAETIPNTEKILSMWKGFLRDVAQYRGRDDKLVQGMADKKIYGELINLTGNEALEKGICDLVSNDYHNILRDFNISYNNVVKYEENIELKLARALANPYMGTFLLTVGFVGMIIEIFTPGFGIGGTISIIAFGLFFGGNIIAGHSQWTSLAIFITGLILLIIEAIIPGFGLPGISGIVLVLAGTILAMGTVTSALWSLSIAIIITAIITILLVKFGHKSKKMEGVVLSTSQQDEDGYLSTTSQAEYLNKTGVTVSELRPSGIIEIDGKRLDALSEGVFIPKEEEIKVVRVEGSKIIVRRI
ncbi:MAG: nodulation protein NfeD [Tissierellia bacterium]|nr:nodulation protein NfeD [Tissierellia bacterium]